LFILIGRRATTRPRKFSGDRVAIRKHTVGRFLRGNSAEAAPRRMGVRWHDIWTY
jgi:hypothetical protein